MGHVMGKEILGWRQFRVSGGLAILYAVYEFLRVFNPEAYGKRLAFNPDPCIKQGLICVPCTVPYGKDQQVCPDLPAVV